MPQGFYKEFIKEISNLGFFYWKPAKGSHEKWRNPVTGKILVVPLHLHSRHMANDLLQDAGGEKKF